MAAPSPRAAPVMRATLPCSLFMSILSPRLVRALPTSVGFAGCKCQAVTGILQLSVALPMLPLSGLRVIAVEQYGAGPFGSMLLGDLGAEVIKIENPAEGGDVSRSVGPHFFADGDSHFFQAFNRNKKSVTLNLKHPQAPRTCCTALVRTADATFDNLRGDQPEKLGAHLRAARRGQPQDRLRASLGLRPRRPAQGLARLRLPDAGRGRLPVARPASPTARPRRMGLSIVDLMTGLNAAFALVSGVLSARATGKGRDIDVNLFDTALQNLCYLAVWYLNAGVNQGREPRSAHPSLVPSQLYRTKDGFIFIMCNKEKFWPELCRGDRPPGVERARRVQGLQGAARQPRQAHRGAGRRPVGADHGRVDRDLRRPRAGGAGQRRAVCAGKPVRHGAGPRAHRRPPLRPHPPARPIGRCPGEELPCEPAPAMGADTDAVLSEAGFTPAETRAGLRKAGAI